MGIYSLVSTYPDIAWKVAFSNNEAGNVTCMVLELK